MLKQIGLNKDAGNVMRGLQVHWARPTKLKNVGLSKDAGSTMPRIVYKTGSFAWRDQMRMFPKKHFAYNSHDCSVLVSNIMRITFAAVIFIKVYCYGYVYVGFAKFIQFFSKHNIISNYKSNTLVIEHRV